MHNLLKKFIKTQKGFFSFSYDKIFFFSFDRRDRPKRVFKLGEFEPIYKEYKNHKFAFSLIPDHVPKVFFFKRIGKNAVISMEFLDNSSLFDLIASCVYKKEKRFFKEAENMYDFLFLWLSSLPYKRITLKEVFDLSQNRSDSVSKIYKSLKGEKVIVLPQHRDFSTANVRYAKNKLVLLDWEDLEKKDLFTMDFSVLTFSLFSFHKSFFKKDPSIEFRRLIKDAISKVVDTFGVKEEVFIKLCVLSLYLFFVQNVEKKRFLTAKKVWNFINQHFKGLFYETI